MAPRPSIGKRSGRAPRPLRSVSTGHKDGPTPNTEKTTGKPVLSYFDFPGGRGEDCRIALHAAGVEFDDDRIKPSDWRDQKEKAPFGKLPIFKVGDSPVISGSNVILATIGRHHDLHPSDPWEAARHEGLMDAVEDIRAHLFPANRPKDEEREALRTEYANGALQKSFSNLAAQVRGPYIGGDSMNVADLKLFILLRFFRSGVYDFVPTTIFDGHPKLVAHFETLSGHPAVTSWYAR